MQTELTAQILETVSVLAADKRLRKPIDVPRPGTPAASRQPARAPQRAEGEPSADVVPIGSARSAVNLLAATRRTVYVR